MRIQHLLFMSALFACSRAPEPPAGGPKPSATPAPARHKKSALTAADQALFAKLNAALPPEPQAREITCLARLVQARMLERRTRDPQAQARIRNARVECRVVLFSMWADRAEVGEGEEKVGACRACVAHLKVLQRIDGIAASKLRARHEAVCPQP